MNPERLPRIPGRIRRAKLWQKFVFFVFLFSAAWELGSTNYYEALIDGMIAMLMYDQMMAHDFIRNPQLYFETLNDDREDATP